MLPPEAGLPVVRRELTAAGRGTEVVVAGALGILEDERHATGGIEPQALDGPIAGRLERVSRANGIVVTTTLDPTAAGFLDDHRIDGTPVLPGVMGIEAFAEAAMVLLPGWQVIAIEDVDLLAPFKFYRDEPRTVETRVIVRDVGDVGDGTLVAECRLVGTRALPGQGDVETVHFTGRVRLAREATPPPAAAAAEAPERTPVGREAVYRIYFHGPAYRVLDRAYRVNGHVMGCFADALPPDLDHGSTQLAPRLIELCFQTAGVYELGTTGRLALPTHVDRVTRYAGAEEPGRLTAVVTPRKGGTDADVVDEHGRLRLRLEGYRTTELPGVPDAGALAPIQEAMR